LFGRCVGLVLGGAHNAIIPTRAVSLGILPGGREGEGERGRKVDGGRGRWGATRVVWRTLARRGKSWTPESRIEMLEDKRALEERREVTQEVRGVVIFGGLMGGEEGVGWG